LLEGEETEATKDQSVLARAKVGDKLELIGDVIGRNTEDTEGQAASVSVLLDMLQYRKMKNAYQKRMWFGYARRLHVAH